MADEQNPNAVAEGGVPPAEDAVDGTVAAVPSDDQTTVPEEIQRLQGGLDVHHLKSPDDVEGLVESLNQFKKGYGDSQNEVGELRRQIAQLTEQVSQRQQAPEDPYGEPQQSPINLRAEIKSAFAEMMTNAQQAAVQGQQRYLQERSRLEQMPNWAQVQPAFDKALQRPEIQQAIQSGQTDMEKVYLHLNTGYLLNVAQGAQNAINSIPEGARRSLSTPPPANEDGRVAQPPSEDAQRAEAINKAKQAGDAQGVLSALIPDSDPITRY